MSQMKYERAPRVLVVENRLPILKAIVNLVEDSGFQAKGAASKRAALDLIETHDFDCAVVDLWLRDPEDTSLTEGVDVCRALRNPTVGTGICVLSGQTDVELAADLEREFGLVKYLQKSKVAQDGGERLVGYLREAAETRDRSSLAFDTKAEFFGAAGDDTAIAITNALHLLGTPGGSTGLLRALELVGGAFEPLMGELPGPVFLRPDDRGGKRMVGSFWSMGVGSAVAIEVGVGESKSGKSGRLLHERSGAGMYIRVSEESGRRRGEFRSFLDPQAA